MIGRGVVSLAFSSTSIREFDATSIGSHVGVFVFQASKQTIRGTRAWCDVLLIGPEAEM